GVAARAAGAAATRSPTAIVPTRLTATARRAARRRGRGSTLHVLIDKRTVQIDARVIAAPGATDLAERGDAPPRLHTAQLPERRPARIAIASLSFRVADVEKQARHLIERGGHLPLGAGARLRAAVVEAVAHQAHWLARHRSDGRRSVEGNRR